MTNDGQPSLRYTDLRRQLGETKAGEVKVHCIGLFRSRDSFLGFFIRGLLIYRCHAVKYKGNVPSSID